MAKGQKRSTREPRKPKTAKTAKPVGDQNKQTFENLKRAQDASIRGPAHK
jgi:hypothetical protein